MLWYLKITCISSPLIGIDTHNAFTAQSLCFLLHPCNPTIHPKACINPNPPWGSPLCLAAWYLEVVLTLDGVLDKYLRLKKNNKPQDKWQTEVLYALAGSWPVWLNCGQPFSPGDVFPWGKRGKTSRWGRWTGEKRGYRLKTRIGGFKKLKKIDCTAMIFDDQICTQKKKEKKITLKIYCGLQILNHSAARVK